MKWKFKKFEWTNCLLLHMLHNEQGERVEFVYFQMEIYNHISAHIGQSTFSLILAKWPSSSTAKLHWQSVAGSGLNRDNN